MSEKHVIGAMLFDVGGKAMGMIPGCYCKDCKWWTDSGFVYGDCKLLQDSAKDCDIVMVHGDVHPTMHFGCVQGEKRP